MKGQTGWPVPGRRLIFCLLALLLFVWGPVVVMAQDELFGVVVKVVDGDSVMVRVQKTFVQVRLWGIDTPEWRQPSSQAAKAFTRSRLLNQTVRLVSRDKDRYGRLVALVNSGEVLVNGELVKAGLAWVHVYYCREDPFCDQWRQWEREAKKQEIGLWQDPEPIPPWIWKQRQQKGNE